MNQSKYIFLVFIIISFFILVRFVFHVSANFSRIFTYKSNLKTIENKLNISKNFNRDAEERRACRQVGKRKANEVRLPDGRVDGLFQRSHADEHFLLSQVISTAQAIPNLKLKAAGINQKNENHLLDLTIETDYESIFEFWDRINALKYPLQINSLSLTSISRDSNAISVNIKLKLLDVSSA